MDRDSELKPQPKIHDNGCCCLCFGKGPGPISTKDILKDGGKYIQHDDGRIVEYFVYGSENPDPKALFLQINGSLGTGWFLANLDKVNEKMKELNFRAISVTIPGHGFTSMFPENYKLGDWSKLDLEPVLKAEGMETVPLMVEGSSYGAGVALGVMNHFGERITHAHLHVPYLPLESRTEFGIPERIGDDACFDKDTNWINSYGSCCYHCACQCCLAGCILTCPSAMDDAETTAMEAAAPGSTAKLHYDIRRAARNGKNTFGLAHNTVGSLISKNWGFDVKEVKGANTKVMISYNIGDTQVAPAETLPKNPHGEWLAEHFTTNAAVCQVNIGGGVKGCQTNTAPRCPSFAPASSLLSWQHFKFNTMNVHEDTWVNQLRL
eukprot:GSChrysophyteH1.ASY1.ANO1.1682.1 assembled CDS